jgi:hypothetical protein
MDKKLAKLTKQNKASTPRFASAAKLFAANRFGPLVFLLVFTTAGAAFIYQSGASPTNKSGSSTGATMYITPSKQTLTPSDSLIATVWVDSRRLPVNAVQAVIMYPADKLSYTSTEAASSQFTVAAQSDETPGKIVIARGSTTPLTGSQLVATVVFKPLVSSGKASLTIDKSSQLLSSDTNQNILSQFTGGQYQFSR